MKNCINCGAPIDKDLNKCPYCGTSYIDICGLEINGKPIVLKFRYGNEVYTTKAYCDSASVDVDMDVIEYDGMLTRKFATFPKAFKIDLSFMSYDNIVARREDYDTEN